MAPKHSLPLVLASAAAAVVAIVACSSSSSDGGAATSDAGIDAALDANVADATGSASDADADAAEGGPCGNYPVPDGDVFTMCLVERCCFELTQCKKDCTDYKTCVIACSQADADPTACIDQCAMQHSNGQVQLDNLTSCGTTKCSAPPSDH